MSNIIYLPGPAGSEQEYDHQQLELRGYTVWSYHKMRKNQVTECSPGEMRRLQVDAMLRADVVVVHDRVPTAHLVELVRIAKYAQLRVVDQATLPAQCPHPFRFDEVMDSLNVVELPEQVSGTVELVVKPSLLSRFEAWFNRRFGWALTNGNKQARAAMVQYQVPPVEHNMTA